MRKFQSILGNLQTTIKSIDRSSGYETYIMPKSSSLLDEMGAPTQSVLSNHAECEQSIVHLIAMGDDGKDDFDSIPEALPRRIRSDSFEHYPKRQSSSLCSDLVTQQIRSSLEHIVTVVFMDDNSNDDDDDDAAEYANIDISTPSGLEVGGSMEEIDVTSTITLSDSCSTRTKFGYDGPPMQKLNTLRKKTSVIDDKREYDKRRQRGLLQLSITPPTPRSSRYQRAVDSLLVNHPSPIGTHANMKQRYQSMVNCRQQQVKGIEYITCSENVSPQHYPAMRNCGKQVKVERYMAELELSINQAKQLLLESNEQS